MENLNRERIHFIGVGGVSMSALARLSGKRGAVASGSDEKWSETIDKLKKSGINAYVGANAEVVKNADLVVYSSAVKTTNEELKTARSLGIPTMDRAEFLSMVAERFGYQIAVGGTHGKTTVTAMLAHVFKKFGLDFVGHVGGETEYGNLVFGGEFENADFAKFVEKEKDGIFLTEGCEYKKNILKLKPNVGVVLNAECDHPDCYPDSQSVDEVFSTFLAGCEVQIFPFSKMELSTYAHVSAYANNIDKDRAVGVFSNARMDVFSYDNSREENGEICVRKNGQGITSVVLPDTLPSTPLNVMFVLAVTDLIGLPSKEVAKAVEKFSGVKRRHEYAGLFQGVRVIFDYAHHPTEIKNVLSAHPDALVVFQPHTYSRTAKYMDDFATVLASAKTLVLMQTYGAREGEMKSADSESVARVVLSKNAESEVYLSKSHKSTIDIVKTLAPHFNEILFLGAGDIYDLKSKITCDGEKIV